MQKLTDELNSDFELREKFQRELENNNKEQEAFERGLQSKASFPKLTEKQRKPRELNLAVQQGVRQVLRRRIM